MKIALLGYGLEGQATKKYFETKYSDATFDIYENETPEQFRQRDYSSYDIIFRSPSVPPLHLPNESSLTKYFFEHCPCPIIGVTATKGKGTICSFTKALLEADGQDVYLVGNIGTPAIEVLDQLKPSSVVVYEMSSFQLWDLKQSPQVAVIGQLEPDHLNVHKDYQDYLAAKANITKYQSADDFLVYYVKNPETSRIAATSLAQKISYPFDIPSSIQNAIELPGQHNLENAMAAIAAVACYKKISPDAYLKESTSTIIAGLQSFHGLPHRLEFVRDLNGVKYYDDSFSTNPSSTRVALKSFPGRPIIPIIGGRDKTDYTDLPELYDILCDKNLHLDHIILIGESGHELANKYHDERFIITESLAKAVNLAKAQAEKIGNSIVLLTPAAASFDMFKNVYDRGDQYQSIVKNL